MRQPGTVYVGPLHTKYLSPSDMVLPLCCNVCIHLMYIGLLIPITVLSYNGYDNIDSCMEIDYEILLWSLLSTHTLILIIDISAMYQSFNAHAFGTNQCLNRLLTCRVLMNFVEIIFVIYGFYAIFFDDNNSDCWDKNVSQTDPMYIMVVLFLSFNLFIILTTWCCLMCCLSSQSSYDSDEDDDDGVPFIHKLCASCIYGEQAAKTASDFYGMGGLINILAAGTNYSASQIVTGLHLLRMLQKHYGISDNHYASNPSNYKEVKDKKLLSECEYYTLFANAAYGILLYTMSEPTAICCAPPCCLPNDFEDSGIENKDKLVLRRKKCCPSVQLDNSSFKVFIQRTECENPQQDVLLVNQVGGLHNVNFYVMVDHDKKALVIAIRGTLSLGDTITDANTEPELFDEIKTDEPCYVHKGIGECAKNTFNTIMQSEAILNFVKDETYKNYDIVICGHSLGSGTTVLLSLIMKYGTNENLKYFINNDRKFRAYAIAPPSCVNREFAMSKNEEISGFLTCVVYGHDIIPRLSFYALIWTQAAISTLLNELSKTENGPWFVYRKSLTIRKDTITETLPADSKYCNDDVAVVHEHDDEKNDGMDTELLLPRSSGEMCFMQDVGDKVEEMRKQYAERLSKKWKSQNPNGVLTESALWKSNELLWNMKFMQIGKMIHLVRMDGNEQDNKNILYGICALGKRIFMNFCRCRCCLDPEDTEYKAFEVPIDSFSDKIVFSKDMMPDHMPHLYLDVLQRLTETRPLDDF